MSADVNYIGLYGHIHRAIMLAAEVSHRNNVGYLSREELVWLEAIVEYTLKGYSSQWEIDSI